MAEQPQQQPPPASRPPQPAGRAALIAAALGLVATVATGAAAVGAGKAAAVALAGLTRLLVRWGYRRETIRWALRVTVRVTPGFRPAPDSTPGPAELANAKAARTFAAWFLERSTARIEQAYADGAEDGAPEAAEDRFLEQHLDAQERREAAARKIDQEATRPGHVTSTEGPDEDGMGRRSRVILRWRAHPDDRTTPECAAADGAWFYADTPPIIGYPGMPHGGTCRCWAAHAGSLAEVARGRHVNDAVRAIISTEPDHRPHPGAVVPAAARTA